MLEGAADGFMTGAITGFISGGLSSSQCFVAGTAILAASGHVLIEDIAAGDYVWATDPETGETGLRRVVQTFENEANELIHVYVNGEEIVTTREHPFYSPVKGWTAACELGAGDMLVLVNGEYVVVEKVQHELLENPVKVYNFEVEGFHTYYVTDSAILVHNANCGPESPVKVKDNQLKGVNVHAFKEEYVGEKDLSRWDIFKDKANNSVIWLTNKAQNIWIKTQYVLEELIDIFSEKG